MGEGAVALVLKRHQDALRDGDRIYALLRGVGAASGGQVELAVPNGEAYKLALRRACEDANMSLDNISMVETHGSGYVPEDDMEAKALAELFSGKNGVDCALGSVKADIGHTGAAAGLAGILKTCLCLWHKLLPPLRHIRSLRTPLLEHDRLFAPTSSLYWLSNRIDGARQAAVAAFSIDGNCMYALIEESDSPQNEVCHYPSAKIFAFYASTKTELLYEIGELRKQSDKQHDLHALACQWWQQSEQKICTATVVVEEICQLLTALDKLRIAIEQDIATAENGIFYSPVGMGKTGQLAFVYPGSGNHFQGMGCELAYQWPLALQRQEQENQQLAKQFAEGRFWQSGRPVNFSHEDVIFGQVWLAAMVTDVIGQFGIKADAIIGYSLGETAGLFATRSWLDRDEMLRRMQNTDLFSHALAGDCRAARKAWRLKPSETVDWLVGIVEKTVADVRQVLAQYPRAYLLIVNTPNECVIGGDRGAVTALVGRLNCNFHPISGVHYSTL